MDVAHAWLGLVITGLNDTQERRRSSPESTLGASPSKESLLGSTASTPRSPGALPEARHEAATPGFPTAGSKDKPSYLPPPPGFPALDNKNDAHLRPPPGFPPIGTKNDPCPSPPSAEDPAAILQVHAAAASLVAAGNEARIPTSTAHGGEIESCPSTTSTVAETESLRALASRFEKLSDAPPQDGVLPAQSSQHHGDGRPAIAVRPADGEVPAATETAAQAAQLAGHLSRAYRNGVKRCSRPRTAVLGMGFPAAIRQYDVTPRTSDAAAFGGTGRQRAAPTTGARERSIPRVFKAKHAAVPPTYCHGAPPFYMRGCRGVPAAWLGAEGTSPPRSPPSWAPRWTGKGWGCGRWAGHLVGGHGVDCQEGNAFQHRCHVGSAQAHWQQRPSPERENHLHHHHIGYTMRGEVPGKNRMKKSWNRRGGQTDRGSGHPQRIAGYGDAFACHAGLAVPHAMAVNGAAFYYPGGGGVYPWQWQRHPVGAW